MRRCHVCPHQWLLNASHIFLWSVIFKSVLHQANTIFTVNNISLSLRLATNKSLISHDELNFHPTIWISPNRQLVLNLKPLCFVFLLLESLTCPITRSELYRHNRRPFFFFLITAPFFFFFKCCHIFPGRVNETCPEVQQVSYKYFCCMYPNVVLSECSPASYFCKHC